MDFKIERQVRAWTGPVQEAVPRVYKWGSMDLKMSAQQGRPAAE